MATFDPSLGVTFALMAHDSDYFRRRAAEVRSAAFHKDGGESVEVAGHLALAYSALARRCTETSGGEDTSADPADAPVVDHVPLMLRD